MLRKLLLNIIDRLTYGMLMGLLFTIGLWLLLATCAMIAYGTVYIRATPDLSVWGWLYLTFATAWAVIGPARRIDHGH